MNLTEGGTGMRRAALTAAVVVAAFLAGAAPGAEAAYVGANGRIAFVSGSDIWTVNPDGTSPVRLTTPTPPQCDGDPAWSPDGKRIAFTRHGSGCGHRTDIYVMNGDGTGESLLVTNARWPTWSPDGTEIAFVGGGGIERMNLDGTNRRLEAYIDHDTACCAKQLAWSPSGSARLPSPLPYRGPSIAFSWEDMNMYCDEDDPHVCVDSWNPRVGVRFLSTPNDWDYNDLLEPYGDNPNWSPSEKELTYATSDVQIGWGPPSGIDGDIEAVNAPSATGDGSSAPRTIVPGPELDYEPAWSPDGTKIVFARVTGAAGLWVVGADGNSPTRILDHGRQPDWQAVPDDTPSEHIRPLSAARAQFSLVPAFRPCTAPNRQHGPPLAHPSCAPPQTSAGLTVDGGGDLTRSKGSMVFKVLPGAPGGADDTDVRVRFELTNVMNARDLSEYTSFLRTSVTVRVTDRKGSAGPDRISSTIRDFVLELDAPCVATPATPEGSTCSLNTTFDAQMPGSTPEGTRAVWELDQVKVRDFVVQGLYIP